MTQFDCSGTLKLKRSVSGEWIGWLWLEGHCELRFNLWELLVSLLVFAGFRTSFDVCIFWQQQKQQQQLGVFPGNGHDLCAILFDKEPVRKILRKTDDNDTGRGWLNCSIYRWPPPLYSQKKKRSGFNRDSKWGVSGHLKSKSLSFIFSINNVQKCNVVCYTLIITKLMSEMNQMNTPYQNANQTNNR